jgi:CRP/FNR family transcriptional regulator, cyclic AMP receptor protein
MMPRHVAPFDAHAFLESRAPGKRVVAYRRGDLIFSQGDPCDSVMYVRSGAVQLSVLSHAGKEAIVGTLDAGDFLGEGALAGHPVRLVTAKAVAASTLLVVPKRQMILARTLLLARYGKKNAPGWVLPKISQTALAEMVGTTRSRVNFIMNKFKKLSFID